MATHRARDLSVGVTSALALAILAFAAMSVGDGFSFFSDRTDYVIIFEETDGLLVGSPVKMDGVTIGTVRSIDLSINPEESGIHVKVGVNPEYAERIREDSVAGLNYLNFVSGEKYVDVSPGSSTLPVMQEGVVIPTATSSELLEQGADIAVNLQQITASFSSILEPIVRGEGLLGELVNDPNFGKDGLAKFKGTLENLEAVTEQISQGRGFVGRMLYDKEFEGQIDRLSSSITRFDQLMATLTEEGGTFSTLIAEDGPLPNTMADLESAAASFKEIASKLEQDSGLLGRLINDEEWSEAMAADVKSLVENLESISSKIDEGEGTLGQLVNERVLHDGLEQVVAGVGDSKFARWLIKHYRKKGIKLDQEDLEELGIE